MLLFSTFEQFMATAVEKETWENFVGVTAPAIVNHVEIEFDSTLALYLGEIIHKNYQVKIQVQIRDYYYR